jgi:hypothetical protein
MRFLDAGVDRHGFAAGNDWFFTGIRIGHNPNDPTSQFWLTIALAAMRTANGPWRCARLGRPLTSSRSDRQDFLALESASKMISRLAAVPAQ